MALPKYTWNLQDAKAKLSEVVDAALAGKPQRILRRGKEAVVVLRAVDYAELGKPPRTLVDVLVSSPHRDVEIVVDRRSDPEREIKL